MAPHELPLLLGDHFEGELIMVSQEDSPLSTLREIGRVGHDRPDVIGMTSGERHVEAGHQREVEVHMALVAVSEVLDGVLGPLIRLRQQQRVWKLAVDQGSNFLEEGMGLGEVLAVGSDAFE